MAAPVILIMGPPGAGKSSQARLLGERAGFVHIATGDLARKVTDSQLLAAVQRGELLDSKVMDRMLQVALEQVPAEQAVILDGFPRRRADARWLEGELPKLGRKVKKAIFLVVEPTESSQRNLRRGRADDTPEAQAERWREYREETLPVIALYKKAGQLVEVSGMGTVAEVAKRLEEAVGQTDAN